MCEFQKKEEVMNLPNKLQKTIIAALQVPKQFDKNQLDKNPIHLNSADNLQMISVSNVFLKFTYRNQTYYFCECRKHEKPKDYVMSFINDYHHIFAEQSFAESDKSYLIRSLGSNENLMKFLKMGDMRIGSKSPCYLFFENGNPELVGLAATDDALLVERMKHFVCRYAWCQLAAYVENKAVPYGKYQTFAANKSLATRSLASLLKTDRLFPECRYTKLIINEQYEFYGLLMEESPGINTIRLPFPKSERMNRITPTLQRDLNKLNLFDVLTLEKDHSPNNYNVILNTNNYAVAISVFDNNGIGTFGIKRSISFSSFKNCSPFIIGESINRPYVDLELAEAIIGADQKQLKKALMKYLTVWQYLAFSHRFNGVKKILKDKLSNNIDIFLKEDQWSEKTINAEMSGEYGKTYLLSFIRDC